MSENERIFYMIADLAISAGLEISIERKNSKSQSRTLGSLSTTDFTDGGLILHVYQPEKEDEDENQE